MVPPQELFDDLQAETMEKIETARAEAQKVAPDIEICHTLAEGSPIDMLLDMSKDVTMIVMGSRGLGGLSGMVMGSVSAAVVSHALCPVVVVREDLGITASVLDRVAAALRANDTEEIAAALASARGTQGGINAMIAAAKAGKESLDVSPLLWHQRRRVRSLIRILNPVDNAIRNTRVLARRALILAEDGDTVAEEQIEIIAELGAITRRLYELFDGKGQVMENTELPVLVRRLRVLGGKVGVDVAKGRVLSAHVILAQSRSLIVDLLQICGLSRRSAAAVLKPTSETPAQPPEVWDG